MLQLHFYVLKQLSSSSKTLPSFPPPFPLPQPQKKTVWKTPNEDQYCLVAELRPVSDNLMVNRVLHDIDGLANGTSL
jgi:hypothetical protein